MGESRNTAAMRAGARAGIKNVIDLTYRLGMPKHPNHPQQPYPTTAIGASEVNPLSMASTAAFLNGGFRVTPRFANDVCRVGKSLLYIDEGSAKDCDIKDENRPVPERPTAFVTVSRSRDCDMSLCVGSRTDDIAGGRSNGRNGRLIFSASP